MNELSERQQHLIDKPEWSLVTCVNTLFDAMRLVQADWKKLLNPDIFSTKFTLVNEEDPTQRIRVNPAREQRPIELRLENIMYNVAACCFMQFDELAKQRLNGNQRFTNPNDDMRNTCSVLYLVRCAFAHNPLVPTWLIKPSFRDKVFEVKDISLRLDTTGLHRQVGVIPRIGGWVGAIRLLQHSHMIISPETAQMMKNND